jgi:signal transduction histidine kinase
MRIGCSGSVDGVFGPDRIGQVLSELLANALRHGKPDAPVTVCINDIDPAWLVLSIHDRGALPASVIRYGW